MSKESMTKLTCKWYFANGRFDWDSYYDTECGESFLFVDGQTKADNENFIYCPFCGGRIKEEDN